MVKLRAFLDSETKRNDGNGIRPIERVPLKVVKPAKHVRYARLSPFCRKARGKIRKLRANLFQGVCPRCGSSGPKRESQQEALLPQMIFFLVLLRANQTTRKTADNKLSSK